MPEGGALGGGGAAVSLRGAATAALVAAVRFYQQALHGFFGYGHCRFSPTCSEYMVGALRAHGPVRGLGLGLWRILRCNPFCRGGYDPVPPPRSRTKDRKDR